MSTLSTFVTRLKAPSAQVAVPVLVLLILVMMLVPLPALLLDLLFTFNIGLSILVLIAALNIRSFKDFIALTPRVTANLRKVFRTMAQLALKRDKYPLKE